MKEPWIAYDPSFLSFTLHSRQLILFIFMWKKDFKMRFRQQFSSLLKKSPRRMSFLFAALLIGTLALVGFTAAGTVDGIHSPHINGNFPPHSHENSVKHSKVDLPIIPIKSHPAKHGKKKHGHGFKPIPTATMISQPTATMASQPQPWPTATPTPYSAPVHAGSSTTTAQPPMVPRLPLSGSDPGSNPLP
jgi:hypothetical protein